MLWFEDEKFWTELYPYMFDETRLGEAEQQVEQIIVLSGVASGAALDLCCGPGRHSAALARRGFAVTGVDRSSFLLGKARERAAGLPIEFVEADMREFIRPSAFDLVVNLFTSFGYLDTREQDLGVLENVRASLKPGGVFVMDLFGKEILAAMPSRTFWKEHADGAVSTEHTEVLRDWTRLRSKWAVLKGASAVRFEFQLNLYSGRELADLLERAGFGRVELFGSLAGTSFDATAKRLVAVARPL